MASIRGTNKADHLVGTAGNDTLDGLRGNDWLEGGQGDDFILTGAGSDKVVMRNGDGHDTVADFTPGEDHVLFDSGTGYYSDIMLPIGFEFTEGASFTGAGGAVWTFHSVDANGDGVMDTRIDMDVGGVISTIDLLGVTLESLHPADFMGG